MYLGLWNIRADFLTNAVTRIDQHFHWVWARDWSMHKLNSIFRGHFPAICLISIFGGRHSKKISSVLHLKLYKRLPWIKFNLNLTKSIFILSLRILLACSNIYRDTLTNICIKISLSMIVYHVCLSLNLNPNIAHCVPQLGNALQQSISPNNK